MLLFNSTYFLPKFRDLKLFYDFFLIDFGNLSIYRCCVIYSALRIVWIWIYFRFDLWRLALWQTVSSLVLVYGVEMQFMTS